MRIAILEDDPVHSKLLQAWLNEAGHTCIPFVKGRDFLSSLRKDTFDLRILDWMLPDITGLDVLRKLPSESNGKSGTLFITVMDGEENIVKALENGADDYLTKPVRKQEFLARIGAVARRYGHAGSAEEAIDPTPYKIDSENETISLDGQSIKLTRREYCLAAFLFANAGRIVSRRRCLEEIWDISSDAVMTRTIDTHICRIRKKLNIGPETQWQLGSVYQTGYRLDRTDQVHH